MTVHRLTRAEARRIAVRAQLLDRPRPAGIVEVVEHLTLLQHDQTAAVAPSADLVLWSRLGSSYSKAELRDLLDQQALLEIHGLVRTGDYLALLRPEMEAWPGAGELRDWEEARRDWLLDNDACRRDILERLRADGPLPQQALPDTCVRTWGSSGWNNNKNVGRMLDLMVQRGEVAVSGREGRDRLWDLAERVYPDVPVLPADEARRLRAELRLRALGIARAHTTDSPSAEPNDVGEVGEAAEIEGVRGSWRVDPEQLDRPFAGRAALLSPLDRLVYDRKRMVDVFEFDYQLEMYKPAAKRRWGYFALPILYGDRLVGKLDATADRKAGVLFVDAIHEDEPFTSEMASEVRREIEDLAQWLELELALPTS